MQTRARRRRFAAVEATAGDDRDVDRSEVRRAHHLVVRRGPLLSSGGGSPAISKNDRPAYEKPSGKVLAQATLRTPGTAAIFALDVVEEPHLRLSGRVLRAERIDDTSSTRFRHRIRDRR